MTAPDARRLAEIVAEGRRLEAERSASSGDYAGQVAIEGALIDFLLDNYGSLLAVAEAADKREATLRAAAREALAVLTRLADSAHRWAGRDVPAGLVAEVDAAKARLAGVLGE